MKSLDLTAVRFFAPFNLMSPVQTGGGDLLGAVAKGLRFLLAAGIGPAFGMIMLNQPEEMTTQNGLMPMVVTSVNFKAEVLESKQPVLVGFWAPWSRPCHVLEAVLQELASAWAGKVKIVKVNADDCLDLSLWYDIQSVPTLLYFVCGNPCLRIVGTASKDAILAKLKPFSQ